MPWDEDFDIISSITNIETIARGPGVDIRHLLNRLYGHANWRKKKGIAEIEYANGQIWLAEVHWYEATGKGMKRRKVKREIRRLG